MRPQVDIRCYGSARVQGAQVVISACTAQLLGSNRKNCAFMIFATGRVVAECYKNIMWEGIHAHVMSVMEHAVAQLRPTPAQKILQVYTSVF